jgi:hypothetical protein
MIAITKAYTRAQSRQLVVDTCQGRKDGWIIFLDVTKYLPANKSFCMRQLRNFVGIVLVEMNLIAAVAAALVHAAVPVIKFLAVEDAVNIVVTMLDYALFYWAVVFVVVIVWLRFCDHGGCHHHMVAIARLYGCDFLSHL